MVNFWHSPLGVLELIKCKALRVRATDNAAVCNYDTPPFSYAPASMRHKKAGHHVARPKDESII